MIDGLIVAHGKMGRGLLNAATVIVGEQEGIYAISNSDLSLEQLQAEIGGILDQTGECIIFADCLGSAYTASRIASRGMPVISGVNLPMLLSFFTKRDRMSLGELVEAVITDGRKGILVK
ncbi:MAG: hypothetical protein H8E46_07090 [FCB group bacterium]|nr:hypothetical protein [FCB group bacterium]